MANIKTTAAEWKKAKAYFEAGLSLGDVVKKTGISKSALSRKSNADGWLKGTQKEQLVLDAIRVSAAKGTLNGTELAVHDELVTDATKAHMFFGNAAAQNVREAMAMPCENHNDFRARADTINKGRENVLGKAPDTSIQINNGDNKSAIKEIRRSVVYPDYIEHD